MKMIRGLVFVLLVASLGVQAQEIKLTGVYKGKGIYIQNSYNAQTKEFCVSEILVNGKKSSANLNLTAIHIPFTGFDLYTPVSITVSYKDSCTARIVNPDAILYHSSFKFDSLVLNDSVMHWYTKGDQVGGNFFVEKLDVDLWDVVKEVRAKGRFQGAQYVYFPEHHDGGNIYRVKYVAPNNRYLYSMEMEHYHYPESVTFSPRVVKDKITLSRATSYEIMDEDGDVILRGNGKVIPLRLLKPGDYSIMLEGEVDTFIKK